MYLRFAKKINFIMLLHKLLLRYSSMVDTHAHFNIWLEQRITVSPPVNIVKLGFVFYISVPLYTGVYTRTLDVNNHS